MLFAVICMILALLLYSIAIWTAHFSHALRTWILAVFTIGFLCDGIGTSLMSIRAHALGHHEIHLHMICGVCALGIMLLHLVWALLSKWKQGKCAQMFHRYSRLAWTIWIAAFITGVPK